MERFREEISTFGNFPTLFMGIVKKDNGLTFYGSQLRIVDASGHVVADDLDPNQYYDYIGERSSLSYLRLPTTSPRGSLSAFTASDPGCLIADLRHPARRSGARGISRIAGTAVLSSFHYHHARLIEIVLRRAPRTTAE
jgi:NAD-reducing hydrogenase large subunit